MSSHDVILQEQFEFWKSHDTNLRVARIMKKAFASAWHKGLFRKKIIFRYPLYLIKIVQSFSCNTHSTCQSSTFKILARVCHPESHSVQYLYFRLEVDQVRKSFYADYTCIYQARKSPLKILIKLNAATCQLTDYSTKRKIKLNDTKTEANPYSRGKQPMDGYLHKEFPSAVLENGEDQTGT